MEKICKNCKHWRNGQAGLGFRENMGVCTFFHGYYAAGKECYLLDNGNMRDSGSCMHFFANICPDCPDEPSATRYKLATGEDFGCVNFEEKAGLKERLNIMEKPMRMLKPEEMPYDLSKAEKDYGNEKSNL